MKDKIAQILWQHWDPIQVNSNPLCRDEYKSYVKHIAVLLNTNASIKKLTAHLYQLETVSMGVTGNQARCQATAQLLINLTA